MGTSSELLTARPGMETCISLTQVKFPYGKGHGRRLRVRWGTGLWSNGINESAQGKRGDAREPETQWDKYMNCVTPITPS